MIKKWTIFLYIGLTGVSTGLLTAMLLDVVDNQASLSDVGRFLFSIPVCLVLLLLFFSPILMTIRTVTQALTQINNGKNTAQIEALPLGLLTDFIEQINTLIANQQDFYAERGRLYEQISEVAAQEERKRLARDLHDSIKQQVFSISISAAAAQVHLDHNIEAARQALRDVKQSAQEAMVEMRALLQQLSPAPLEKSGLIEALREQCEALAYRTGAHVDTHFGALPPDDRFAPGAQVVLFRTVQEALSNIARHARANHVELRMEVTEADRLVLTITDDGQGFDTSATSSGMGLGNIKSRAESIHAGVAIDSQPQNGTTIQIDVPLIDPITEEVDMFAVYEPHAKHIITLYWRVVGALSAMIFASTLLISRAIENTQDFASTLDMQIIVVALALTVIIATPIFIINYRDVVQQVRALNKDIGKDNRVTYYIQRHQYFAAIVIVIVAGWFVPFMTITDGNPTYTPLAIAALTLIATVWYYLQMGKLYHRELEFLNPVQRIEELNTRLKELRVSWLSIGILLVVQFITLRFDDDFRLPPMTDDNWMITVLMSLTILLLINQIVTTVVYRRWRQKAELEGSAA